MSICNLSPEVVMTEGSLAAFEDKLISLDFGKVSNGNGDSFL